MRSRILCSNISSIIKKKSNDEKDVHEEEDIHCEKDVHREEGDILKEIFMKKKTSIAKQSSMDKFILLDQEEINNEGDFIINNLLSRGCSDKDHNEEEIHYQESL